MYYALWLLSLHTPFRVLIVIKEIKCHMYCSQHFLPAENFCHTVHNAWHSSIFCRQRGLFCLTAPCLELARRCHLLAVTQLMTDWSRCCVVLQRHRSASIMRAGPHPPTLRCKLSELKDFSLLIDPINEIYALRNGFLTLRNRRHASRDAKNRRSNVERVHGNTPNLHSPPNEVVRLHRVSRGDVFTIDRYMHCVTAF